MEIKIHYDSDGMRNAIKQAIINGTNELMNKKLKPLLQEISKEPKGKFTGRMVGNQIKITHSGFSPELAAKIDQLL